ncbi:MAG TPA: hypothetical protein VGV60_16900 [Candidatus Polarisedimenticolia bacterium]|jgi:hypothetical protein|nr:hypothetical protein [Candidatus Polarisedimenticolia bacterium]
MRYQRGSDLLVVACGVLWLLVVGAGMAGLWAYARSPGAAGSAPSTWPAGSSIHPESDRATLVMLVHPHCPCTRASIHELDRLMARTQGLFLAHVLFLLPAGVEGDWTQTDLWRTAAAIPGVEVAIDANGRESALFGAVTSGLTLLYSPYGRLLFEGGITQARGHEGDNPGADAIASLLRGDPTGQHRAPVFGCSLKNPERAITISPPPPANGGV